MCSRDFSILASVAGAAAFAALVSATPPQIGPNVRVNAIFGPDATASTVDDDDPNDQSFVKAQNSTTVTVIRSEGDPILFGAWNDRSWYDVTGQGESNDFSVGFAPDDLSLSWPVHDIVRQADGDPEDLPFPVGDGPDYWLSRQVTPKAAVIPPESPVPGVYLVGEDARGRVDPNDPNEVAGQRLWFAWSADGQPDWTVKTILWEPDEPQDNDPDIMDPYLTVWKDDPNDPDVHMLVTWTEVPQGPQEGISVVFYSISDDSGETFSEPARLSDPDDPPDYAGDAGWSASAFGPGPAGDAVYVVWYQDSGFSVLEEITPPAIKWRRYSVGTQTWSPQTGTNGSVVAEITPVGEWTPGSSTTLPLNFPLYDQASVVVDHSPGRVSTVYVAFSQLVEKYDPLFRIDPDIFVATLRPGASDFEDPVKVNDDPPIPFGDPNDLRYMPTLQFMPWVAVTDQGHVGVGWYDRRDHVDADEDGQDFNRLHHYYFAYSVDGGRHFSENVQVSEEQSDPVPASGVNTRVDMGSFTSIGGVRSSIVPLWIDLRDWDPSENQPDRLGDVYSAEIRICEGNGPDGDNDCDVDSADFALFGQCYEGSGNPVDDSCLTWDFDFDGDVDTADYSVWNQAYTGSLTPCDWGCQEESLNIPDLEELLENEEIAALYELLEDYCDEHGIPFP